MQAYAPEDYKGPTKFVHLHNHTVFSTLDGVSTPEQYAAECHKRGYPAMSATEHGTMGSVPDMHFAFKKYGLKAIAGCELYFNDYDLERKDFLARGGKINQLKVDDPFTHQNYARNRHLTVLAKNQKGFENLVKLTTQAYETGYYYRPRIWFDKLCEFREGLIVLSGCLNGPVSHELRRTTPEGEPAPRYKSKDKRGALDWAKRFKAVFGDDYKMETQMPGIPGDDAVFRAEVEIADMLKIDLALANDCCHPETPVLTPAGLKSIDSLVRGDLVLTHTGRYREVEHINRRPVDEEIVCVKVGSEIHKFTGNHPVAVVVSSAGQPDSVEFVEASALTAQSRLFFPSIRKSKRRTGVVRMAEHLKMRAGTRVENGMVRTASPRSPEINIPEVLPITEDLCYLLGLYAAEGYVDTTQDYKLCFGLHKDETTAIARVEGFFRAFGLNPDTRLVTENGACVRVCSAPFANLFESLCGNGHLNKKLPAFWNDLDSSLLKALLAGCFDGDGSISDTSVQFFSTSSRLVCDVRLAMTRLGRYSNIKYRGQATDKREHIDTSTWNRLYYLNYGLGVVEELALDCDKQIRDEGRPLWRHTSGGFSIPINRLSREHYAGHVVNLQVEEDETYCLTNFAVHNCHYLHRRDHELQMIMMAIDQKTTINDPNMFHVNSDEQYMKTRAELWARFKNNGYSQGVPDSIFEQMCDNTLSIAESCESLKLDGTPKIPSFDDADNKLRELVVKKLVEKGYHKIGKRYLIDGREVTYTEQVQIELGRITDKGFSSYFLITHDIIGFGVSKGWPFSPRGSAGGSLVNHLLGISPINPLPWGLSFDRFLSPSRGGYMLKCQMGEPVSKNGQPVMPALKA